MEKAGEKLVLLAMMISWSLVWSNKIVTDGLELVYVPTVVIDPLHNASRQVFMIEGICRYVR